MHAQTGVPCLHSALTSQPSGMLPTYVHIMAFHVNAMFFTCFPVCSVYTVMPPDGRIFFIMSHHIMKTKKYTHKHVIACSRRSQLQPYLTCTSAYTCRHRPHGVFTPEQDTDKTTTRQMLNLCIPMMPFTLVRHVWCERHHRNAQVQLLSCRCLVVILLWCENTIKVLVHFQCGVMTQHNM